MTNQKKSLPPPIHHDDFEEEATGLIDFDVDESGESSILANLLSNENSSNDEKSHQSIARSPKVGGPPSLSIGSILSKRRESLTNTKSAPPTLSTTAQQGGGNIFSRPMGSQLSRSERVDSTSIASEVMQSERARESQTTSESVQRGGFQESSRGRSTPISNPSVDRRLAESPTLNTNRASFGSSPKTSHVSQSSSQVKEAQDTGDFEATTSFNEQTDLNDVAGIVPFESSDADFASNVNYVSNLPPITSPSIDSGAEFEEVTVNIDVEEATDVTHQPPNFEQNFDSPTQSHAYQLNEHFTDLGDEFSEPTAVNEKQNISANFSPPRVSDRTTSSSLRLGSLFNESAQAKIRQILADTILVQQYNFTSESIRIGDVTLVFAQNKLGSPVVLRQIWDGDPAMMPEELQIRIQSICAIETPFLIKPVNLFASESGGWAEFQRPHGFRLADVIRANGPQASEVVQKWMTETAQVLGAVHESGVAYANLTPESIWVQENGPVYLEPFDVLAFENHGNLGQFGPHELHISNDANRATLQLSPAADIYSLSAVTLAALTGLPLDYDALAKVDEPFKTLLKKGLMHDPNQRYATTQAFIDALNQRAKIKLTSQVFIVAVGVILSLFLIVMLLTKDKKADVAPPVSQIEEHAHLNTENVSEPKGAIVDPPAPIKRDPSVEIETSYVINPPEQEELDDSAPTLKELIETDQIGDNFAENRKEREAVKNAIRMHLVDYTDELTHDDWKTITQFNRLPQVVKGQERVLKTIRPLLENHDIKRIVGAYREVATIDPTSVKVDRLSNGSWRVVDVAIVKAEINEGNEE